MPAWDSRKCWAEAEALDRPHLRAKDLVVSAQAVAQLSLFEEFGVCPPFLGVYVCFLEAFIFLILSGSLLRKHWGLARRNLTTLDLVIQQTQIEQGICVRPPVNPFDIGVKGNLHQVFGDGDADGEHIHANFIARWFCRLLPVAAYPEQEQLRYASSVSSERSALVSTDPALWAGGAQASIPNYGTLQKGDLSGGVGQVTVIEGRGVCNVYHLSQVSSHVGSLLGQTFPTAVPLTSPTPV
ncbi:palmitoyl acyltransferase 2 [Trypanosoma brucei equiperdum]|nr:palmitoyl acyltransferase 2 [Trypanosoma brucei equiperdum]